MNQGTTSGLAAPWAAAPWGLEHRHALVNGLNIHYTQMGRGPLVLFLHGFPEFWFSWRHQLPALAGAGFRALAPDLRGFNESDKPLGARNYRLPMLTSDVAGLLRHTGAARAVVVGHDWGGVIAWHFAMTRPEMVERLIILNAPHPAAFFRELRDPRQWLRSAYILFFQLPWLPERLLAANDFALVGRVLGGHPRAFAPEDVRRYQQALARPGALTAALNYYRALLRYPRQGLHRPLTVRVPTLLIWGEKDPYLSVRMSEGLEAWVPQLQVERLPEASHWVQNEAPAQVNRLLLDFLRQSR